MPELALYGIRLLSPATPRNSHSTSSGEHDLSDSDNPHHLPLLPLPHHQQSLTQIIHALTTNIPSSNSGRVFERNALLTNLNTAIINYLSSLYSIFYYWSRSNQILYSDWWNLLRRSFFARHYPDYIKSCVFMA